MFSLVRGTVHLSLRQSCPEGGGPRLLTGPPGGAGAGPRSPGTLGLPTPATLLHHGPGRVCEKPRRLRQHWLRTTFRGERYRSMCPSSAGGSRGSGRGGGAAVPARGLVPGARELRQRGEGQAQTGAVSAGNAGDLGACRAPGGHVRPGSPGKAAERTRRTRRRAQRGPPSRRTPFTWLLHLPQTGRNTCLRFHAGPRALGDRWPSSCCSANAGPRGPGQPVAAAAAQRAGERRHEAPFPGHLCVPAAWTGPAQCRRRCHLLGGTWTAGRRLPAVGKGFAVAPWVQGGAGRVGRREGPGEPVRWPSSRPGFESARSSSGMRASSTEPIPASLPTALHRQENTQTRLP